MPQDYIIPTKKNPVFTAVCTDFGYIEKRMYKNWRIFKEGIINQNGDTFALTYFDAVRYLHEWVQEHDTYVRECKNVKFRIEMIDGSLDRFGDVIYQEVYCITASKAKKVQLV